MALPNTTTLSAAQGKNDTTILLASVADLALGNLIRVEDEFEKIIGPLSTSATTPQPVLRGQEGTAQVAHASGVKARLGANPSASVAGDWGNPSAGGAQPNVMPQARVKRRLDYAAAGAITLPNPGEDMEAIIIGAVALAMTIANPSKLNDGDSLTISGDGKAAHTVTYAAGLGGLGAGATVVTYRATQAQAIELVASGGFWNLKGVVAGAATVAGAGLA